ncbi:MAG TPA: GspE/PulE family protein, partial [Gemmatimonadaceae bacterium]
MPGLISSDDAGILAALAVELHLEVADLRAANPSARALVPERWARQFRVLPLYATDERIVLATADPLDLECETTLAFATGRTVGFELAAPAELSAAVNAAYGGASSGPTLPEPHRDVQMLTAEGDVAPPTLRDDDGGGSITRLVDDLLADGVNARASDIQIEPEEQGIAVRHRVDGVLKHVRTLPRGLARSLVSRIKIISGLDIADRLRPQDGRARVAVNGAAVDLRVSTLPASRGEKVVIRILDRRSALHSLDAMGFRREEYTCIDNLLECREGLILVTGPTGSGKTTTLYAALQRLQERNLNIVTVEDPIEYRIPGIVQVQVHERAGLTFASALRSIMRQDPDVLLIGEIRDRETAEIAIQASLTGHLVLSTLHTNDAASAVTRLVDFGVAPYKIATAVKGVLAQRLVRRLCECGAASAPDP